MMSIHRPLLLCCLSFLCALGSAEAKKALEIILAIYESTRTGLPVKLPLAG